MVRRLVITAFLLFPASAAFAHPGQVTPSVAGLPNVAAAQVALSNLHLYSGTIDGLRGRQMAASLAAFQQNAGLPPSGKLTVATLKALAATTEPMVGPLQLGSSGFSVAALQFRIAWHGFPSGPFTTSFTTRLQAALMKFQNWASLPPDGIAGARTQAALSVPVPESGLLLAWPLHGALGDSFGPRANGFHTGIDVAAPAGTPVRSAASGVVVQAGMLPGGWGRCVTVDHGSGVETVYAHLSRVSTAAGSSVAGGTVLGAVGSTGDATGPHLHFEERLRGAAIDPLRSLPPAP